MYFYFLSIIKKPTGRSLRPVGFFADPKKVYIKKFNIFYFTYATKTKIHCLYR